MYQRIQRFGVYGVITNDSKTLLVKKVSDPYKGKWDLPGGLVQFGESPETTLIREVLEETGLSVNQYSFLRSDAHVLNYTDEMGQRVTMHHVGWLFKVDVKPPYILSPKSDDEELEQVMWCDLNELDLDSMTPFLQEFYLEQPNLKK